MRAFTENGNLLYSDPCSHSPYTIFFKRHSFMILRLLVIIAAFLCLSSTVAEARGQFFATVNKVIDGDSLLITAGGRNIDIRLYGIDAPEYNQPFAEEAKNYIRQWVGWRRIMVQPLYVDSYKRTVAIITQGDRVLNNDLVQTGLAWVYPRYCRKDVCETWKKMESAAHADNLGLWRDKQAVSPWKWKRMASGK
jgi:micrococcal nuclease